MYEIVGEGVAQSLFRFEYNSVDETANVFVKDSASLLRTLEDTYSVSISLLKLGNLWCFPKYIWALSRENLSSGFPTR